MWQQEQKSVKAENARQDSETSHIYWFLQGVMGVRGPQGPRGPTGPRVSATQFKNDGLVNKMEEWDLFQPFSGFSLGSIIS